MWSIRALLTTCYRATASSLDINLSNLMWNNTVEVEFDGFYPTVDETVLNNKDRNHPVKVGNLNFTSDILPFDLNEKPVTRTHTIRVEVLHELCLFNYTTFIVHKNLAAENNAIVMATDFLKEFEKFYTMILLTQDDNLRRDYRRYWREISLNVANAINQQTEFNAALNNSVKAEIKAALNLLNSKF